MPRTGNAQYRQCPGPAMPSTGNAQYRQCPGPAMPRRGYLAVPSGSGCSRAGSNYAIAAAHFMSC